MEQASATPSGPDRLSRASAAGDALVMLAGRALGDFDRALATLEQSEDPEGPHQARVALRRLRTHLRAARQLSADRALAPLEAEARALFRTLGALRDADVLLHDVGALDAATLARRFATAATVRADVRARLEAARARDFAARAAAMLAAPDWRGPRAAWPVDRFAARALDRAMDRVAGHGKRLDLMPDAERHEARKDLKALRYLVDDFAPLFPAKKVAPFRRRLRRLQDSLGLLNDLALARAQEGEAETPEAAQRRTDALASAAADWRALRKAHPFW